MGRDKGEETRKSTEEKEEYGGAGGGRGKPLPWHYVGRYFSIIPSFSFSFCLGQAGARGSHHGSAADGGRRTDIKQSHHSHRRFVNYSTTNAPTEK